MKKTFRRNNIIDDMAALRAFVMPELYPFLLDAYKKDGKNEAALRADIRSAREKYKELCAVRQQLSRSGNPSGSSPERSSELTPPQG
jgi:hypothetical protein